MQESLSGCMKKLLNDRKTAILQLFCNYLKALKTRDFQRTIAEIAEYMNFLFILIVMY